MTHPTDDPLREALELLPCPFCGGEAGVIHIENGPNEGGSCVSCSVCLASSNVEFGRKENFRDNWNRRAALAAAPQPAPAPAADERAEMIEVIVQADDAYDRVQGGTWAGAIADALLAAGYRKADGLADERETLAWAMVGGDGRMVGINYDRGTAQHLCNPGERVVSVAIRIVEDQPDGG